MDNYCNRCINDLNDDCEILFTLLIGEYDDHVTAQPHEMFGECSEFEKVS